MNATEAAEGSKAAQATQIQAAIADSHSQIEAAVKCGFTNVGIFTRHEISEPVAAHFRDLDYRVEVNDYSLTIHWSPVEEPARRPAPSNLKIVLWALGILALVLAIAVGGVLLIAYQVHP